MRLSDVWVVVVSVLGLGVLFFILFNILFVSNVEVDRCVEVNLASGFLYDTCYDSTTKSIFMLVEGEMSSYEFDSFGLEFFDVRQRDYDLIYENVEMAQLYKIGAEKNPDYVNLTLNVVDEFDFPICEAPRRLTVRDCLGRNPGRGEGSLNGSVVENRVSIRNPTAYYNISNFVNSKAKEELWRPICESSWSCSDWEKCDNGLQYRSCFDVNNCVVSLDAPKSVRVCGEQCEESWVCNWSECIDDVTIPTCVDENSCGSSYVFPPNVSCSFGDECFPVIKCGDWSDCDYDYNLKELLEKDIVEIGGTESRVCRDLNSCVEPLVQSRECSFSVDVYVDSFVECGEEFIGVYDMLNDRLIVRISEGTEDEPRLDIFLDEDFEDIREC
ncbi:MAG: hypothetical protein V1888_00725 [archaeon]